MGYIYKITNTVNGKVYIGQTKRDIPTRWHEHLYYSHHKNRGYNSILHNAVRKYGDDAFTIEEIEKCKISMLAEREKYWIKHYDSANHGYNISHGGQGWNKGNDEEVLRLWNNGLALKEIAEIVSLHPATVGARLRGMGVPQQDIIDRGNQMANKNKTKPIYQYSADGYFIRGFESVKEAEEILGFNEVRCTSGRHGSVHGYQFKRYKTDRINAVRVLVRKPKPIKNQDMPRRKKVVQFDLEGNYIRTFDSVDDAAKAVNKSKQIIFSSCNGAVHRGADYQWRYLPDAEKCGMKLDKIAPNPKQKKVHQYTLDGEYIKSYPSISSAAAEFGLRGTGGIRAVCTGKIRQNYGYRWSYEKVDRLPPMRATKAYKAIVQLDKDGNFIQRFDKIKEASQATGIGVCAISSVLNGRYRTAGGYRWEFYGNYISSKEESA